MHNKKLLQTVTKGMYWGIECLFSDFKSHGSSVTKNPAQAYRGVWSHASDFRGVVTLPLIVVLQVDTEADITSPVNIYGETKLKGELSIQNVHPDDSVIVRTSWLYSSFGNNLSCKYYNTLGW